jgi:hypothetical protein
MAQKQIPGIETELPADEIDSSEDLMIIRDTSSGSDKKIKPGTVVGRNVGTADDEVPTNNDLGSAAKADIGTADDEVPTNNDLGSAAKADIGTADDEVPTNNDLGTVVGRNVGTADDEVPTNADASGLTWSDESTADKYQLAVVDGVLMIQEA